MSYDHALMLDESNQFAFACPNFGTEVQARICFKLNDLFMVGRPHEKRRGCAACMAANKCPVGHMIKEQLAAGDNRYYSDTPKVGRLSAKVIERIRPLGVLESTYANYAVNPAERAAIEAATGILADKSAHRRTVEIDDVEIHHEPKPRRQAAAKAPKREEKVEADSTVEAAISGDMSAALTKATASAALPHSEPHTIPEPGTPHDNPRMKDAPGCVEPKPTPKPAAPAKGMSLLELAKRKKESAA